MVINVIVLTVTCICTTIKIWIVLEMWRNFTKYLYTLTNNYHIQLIHSVTLPLVFVVVLNKRATNRSVRSPLPTMSTWKQTYVRSNIRHATCPVYLRRPNGNTKVLRWRTSHWTDANIARWSINNVAFEPKVAKSATGITNKTVFRSDETILVSDALVRTVTLSLRAGAWYRRH